MEGDLLLQMLAVAQRMRRELREFAHSRALSATELLALHIIASSDLDWEASSLARRLGCSRIQGFRISQKLVRVGFASDELDSRHPSYRFIHVTHLGRETYQCALGALDAHCFSYFSPDDKRQLHLLLSRMARREPMRFLVE